ncbi:MAG TPA: cytochrome c biogenesis protein CcsA [Longimicrobiales bacterium]
MIHYLVLLLYIGAFVLWLRTLVDGRSTGGPPAAPPVAVAGVVAHAVALAAYVASWGELPLVGLGPSLSSLSFIIGLGLVASLAVGEAGRVGILLIPIMILLEGSGLIIGVEPAPASLDFRGAWFALHVTLAFAGIGGMALAAASGALYLAQHRELKSRRAGPVFQFLPPLATLGRMSRVGAVAGFTTLTLALALGWAWTVRFRHSFQGTDPKTIWSVFVWTVILATVLAQRTGRGPERRGAVFSIVGFLLIVASYLVVRVAERGGLFL